MRYPVQVIWALWKTARMYPKGSKGNQRRNSKITTQIWLVNLQKRTQTQKTSRYSLRRCKTNETVLRQDRQNGEPNENHILIFILLYGKHIHVSQNMVHLNCFNYPVITTFQQGMPHPRNLMLQRLPVTGASIYKVLVQ